MVQLLATLTLRHESQLQALAVQDNVHIVSPAGDFQHHSSYSADNSSLEARSGPENGYTVSAPQARDHDLSGTPGQDAEGGSSIHYDGYLARSHSPQPHHGGWSVELPVLESTDQTGTSHAETTHLDDQQAFWKSWLN